MTIALSLYLSLSISLSLPSSSTLYSLSLSTYLCCYLSLYRSLCISFCSSNSLFAMSISSVFINLLPTSSLFLSFFLSFFLSLFICLQSFFLTFPIFISLTISSFFLPLSLWLFLLYSSLQKVHFFLLRSLYCFSISISFVFLCQPVLDIFIYHVHLGIFTLDNHGLCLPEIWSIVVHFISSRYCFECIEHI